MRVAELWRYPVKSLQGERLDSAELTAEGIEGDRRYAIFDLETGYGLTARRAPDLLFAYAGLTRDGELEITLPDGSVAADDDALSRWVGRPVALRSAGADGERHYESPVDFEHEREGDWKHYEGPEGAFHDAPEVRVSLVSEASLGGWDRRRFRSNVVLDGSGEEELVGQSVELGGAVLDVTLRIVRCVLTTRAQPDGVERDLDVLRTIARERDACLAVGATVARPGPVRLEDAVTIVTTDRR
jgi:uncharacterized protein YcbX